MTTFEMLQELLAQNEFELLLPEDHTANTTEQDIRLVYQMNDTVESFLVFREAIFTGTYKKDYEGKLDASYDRDQNRSTSSFQYRLYIGFCYAGKSVFPIGGYSYTGRLKTFLFGDIMVYFSVEGF